MPTTTTRLGLTKPSSSDNVSIDQLNANADKLDAAVGTFVCTSATRPASPWNGLTIYETDTQKTYVYNASSWTLVNDYSALVTAASRLGVKVWVQATQPTATAVNELWFWGS